RYDIQTGKLVNDDLGVAYSVLHGVPQLVPLLGEVLPQLEAAAPPEQGQSEHHVIDKTRTRHT
ncbi:hypothetical protein VOLCADRAFT_65492, partial [Volvox carteri f. nagariensis]